MDWISERKESKLEEHLNIEVSSHHPDLGTKVLIRTRFGIVRDSCLVSEKKSTWTLLF
jgi:hypothetical protein